MSAKSIVLITGGNSGIGLATAKALWDSPKTYHILAAGRSLERVQQAVSEIRCTPSAGSSTLEEIVIDISDDATIAEAVEHVQATHGRIDSLVNNAGGGFDTEYETGQMSQREAWNKTMELNITSPQVMTTEFAPLLLKSSEPRLLVITSGMSSLAEEHEKRTPGEKRQQSYSAGWPKPGRTAATNAYAYRVSKTGLNMMFLHWVRMFEPDGVKCFSVSPGFVATRLAGDPERMKTAGAADASVAGNFIRDVLEGKRDQDANQAIRRDGLVQPW
ncbi:hypothetical protein MMC30_002855 [Trapelia coarctata]|nr:hypothetical protein [Trapelia coarctata]